MKKCPTCARAYADETLTYCLADGSLLSAPQDSEATQRIPASRVISLQTSKGKSVRTRYLPLLLTFFVLASLATLFPPYNWGEERLQTEEGKNNLIYGARARDVLPLKDYAFLFGDSAERFDRGRILRPSPHYS